MPRRRIKEACNCLLTSQAFLPPLAATDPGFQLPIFLLNWAQFLWTFCLDIFRLTRSHVQMTEKILEDRCSSIEPRCSLHAATVPGFERPFFTPRYNLWALFFSHIFGSPLAFKFFDRQSPFHTQALPLTPAFQQRLHYLRYLPPLF